MPSVQPAFSDMLMLDAVLARLQVSLDAACHKGDLDLQTCDPTDLLRALDLSPEQLPLSSLLALIQTLSYHARSSLLQQMGSGDAPRLGDGAMAAYGTVVAVCSGAVPLASMHMPFRGLS